MLKFNNDNPADFSKEYINCVERAIDKLNYNDFHRFISKYKDFQDKMKLDEYPEYLEDMLSETKNNIHKMLCKYKIKIMKVKKMEEKHTELENRIVDRYHSILVNRFIRYRDYHPTYFDKKYEESKKWLKDNTDTKKACPVQITRCSFLLAAVLSFKEYIEECFPEKSEDFQKHANGIAAELLKICETNPTGLIEGKEVLSEFAGFVEKMISANKIIDIEVGGEAELGWLNRSKNELLLSNENGGANLYGEFTRYLRVQKKRTNLSKTSFVADVLDVNGIISKRTAGSTERYDKERKIKGLDKKRRVLVLNYKALREYTPKK